MPLPSPEPGMVLRYDYLWSREALQGRQQSKDRPTCLVAASDSQVNPRYVVLLPITHSPPSGASIGIEIPPKARKAIGLDDEPSWVIISEYNIDEWPNAGLTQVPGKPGIYSYGFLPPSLFGIVKSKFSDLVREKRARSVKR
jgi:hypothetical protein